MEDKKEFFLIVYIFMLGFIFSAISLLDSKIRTDEFCCEGKTKVRVMLEFICHSMISGVVAIIVFSLLTEYYGDWSVYLRGSIAVMGSAISDTIIERLKGWVTNGK